MLPNLIYDFDKFSLGLGLCSFKVWKQNEALKSSEEVQRLNTETVFFFNQWCRNLLNTGHFEISNILNFTSFDIQIGIMQYNSKIVSTILNMEYISNWLPYKF